ncbi:SURF1 family protein [Rhizobium sp. RU36D]|uniref:SURF1 family protein n=1 Tax=Rhizobium sp. RU36D TaxID=1907415 RepID=UPI0009D8189A|nr:SURF1 family protein [Rhizobium sp. RU36D]SMC91220.1 surfeit locus 1 family protein [Rhizobium sp. RU36D]
MAEAKAGRIKVVATLLLLAVTLCVLLSLGTWQVQRLHWKEALIADIAERTTAAPADVTSIESIGTSGGDIDYRKMSASGRYMHDKERHFFATFRGRTGFYVYTPLELSDGRYLLVNRGFVPYDNKAPETRSQGQVPGEVTVTGLARVRLSEKPSSIVPDNDLGKNIFYWKDLDAMVATAGLPADRVLPFFLDADATPVPGGLPEGGVTQIDLPNSHLEYAVTWYGLAAALVAVSLTVFLRRRKG